MVLQDLCCTTQKWGRHEQPQLRQNVHKLPSLAIRICTSSLPLSPGPPMDNLLFTVFTPTQSASDRSSALCTSLVYPPPPPGWVSHLSAFPGGVSVRSIKQQWDCQSTWIFRSHTEHAMHWGGGLALALPPCQAKPGAAVVLPPLRNWEQRRLFSDGGSPFSFRLPRTTPLQLPPATG